MRGSECWQVVCIVGRTAPGFSSSVGGSGPLCSAKLTAERVTLVLSESPGHMWPTMSYQDTHPTHRLPYCLPPHPSSAPPPVRLLTHSPCQLRVPLLIVNPFGHCTPDCSCTSQGRRCPVQRGAGGLQERGQGGVWTGSAEAS